MASQDLRGLWEELHFFQGLLGETNCGGLRREGIEGLVRKLKIRIREANRNDDGSRIIKSDDDGFGYVELVPLPLAPNVSREAAKDFFRACMCIEPRDEFCCTGYGFTLWYKVFKRGGLWYAYHSVRYEF